MSISKSYIADGGYSGYSMSNRAVEAYECGEAPLSKWTKGAIISTIECYAEDEEINLEGIDFGRLTLKELRMWFLRESSWHHVGKYFNPVTFYELDENMVETTTHEDIERIISRRIRHKKSEEELQKERANKALLKDAREVYISLAIIYESGILKYKYFSKILSNWRDGKFELNDIYQKALAKIAEEYKYSDDFNVEEHTRKGYNNPRRFPRKIIGEIKSELARKAKAVTE